RTGLPAGTAERALRSDAFGPLAAALGRAEEAGWDPDAEFPRLAAGSLAGADDPAAVLCRRLALVADRLEARPTRRAAARLLGMFPEVAGPVSPAMREALDQRKTALEARANEMLRRAAAGREPWLTALGPRPRDHRLARRWDRAALAAAAYRDRYEITGPEPLGTPATLAQTRDAARVRGLVEGARLRVVGQVPAAPTRPVMSSEPGPSL
ncbi:MAG: hypothetical protein LBK95_08320, partial [Bifidobacteriaceae bacterium]|nr:hypothetical protein [Bifidobacteriaceae bacterium]